MNNPLALWALFLAILMAGSKGKSEIVTSVYAEDIFTISTNEMPCSWIQQ
jgi:hypothetical protein